MRGLRILMCALLASSPLLACSGASDGEAAAQDKMLEPLAEPFPADHIQADAALVRLSRAFFSDLNANWKELVLPIVESMAESSPMLSGAHLSETGDLVIPVEVPCQSFPISELGNTEVWLCDTDKDGACAADGSESCPVDVIAKSLELMPSGAASAGSVTVSAEVALGTAGDGLTIALAGVSGSIAVDSSKSIALSLGFNLSLDADAPNRLHFELAEVSDGTYLDGLNDLAKALSVEISVLPGWLNEAVDLVVPLTVTALSKQIQSALKTGVDKALAQRCAFPTDDPEEEGYLSGTCANGQTCACFSGDADCERADLRCQKADGSFPSIYPGYEARVVLGKKLSAFGADAAAAFDFSVVAGGTLDIAGQTSHGSSTGQILLGALAGTLAFPDEAAACVPPTMGAPERVELKEKLDLSLGAQGHQLGVAISANEINEALYQVTRSGALCLDIGTETVSMLTSSLFAGFVPSLSLLGKDLPMSLALRPGQAPRLTLDKNRVREGAIEAPLATLDLEDLSIDVYASIEERFVRLFTLNLDVSAPVAVEIGADASGQTTIKPVLGSISKMLVFNTEVDANSEILTEDISNFGTQLASLLSMADGLIGGFLKAYAISDVAGLRFQLHNIEGLGEGAEGGYGYLGAFVSIAPAVE